MGLFEKSLQYTLENEGGFSNNPVDAGGPTNYGITQADYSAYLGYEATVEDVENISLETVAAIYRQNYWCDSFDDLDNSVATCIFDWGVLHGIISARILAQDVANELGAALKVDGIVGPLTVAALDKIEPAIFIANYSGAVKDYFQSIVANDPSQAVFLNGWDARADRMLTLI